MSVEVLDNDQVEYVSSGCNRSPHCMAWSHVSGHVYYGSHACVQVYSVAEARVVTSLPCHSARVNSVRCVSPGDGSEYIVSASTDKTVAVWSRDQEGGVYRHVSTIRGHAGPVTCVAARVVQGSLWIASTGNDNIILVSRLRIDGANPMETDESIKLGTGLCLELHLTCLPGVPTPVLLVARDNCNIEILDRAEDGCWARAGVLPGHEDWVRCLDSRLEGDDVMVASGGQDSYVRLWRLSRAGEERMEETEELTVKEEVVSLGGEAWGLGVESVLAGHEGWVYGVQWAPGLRARLLTASMDKTMMVWEQTEQTEEDTEQVWLERVRVGETGGNTLGFLGAAWADDGAGILGYSWGGAFHLWRESEEAGRWQPGVIGGGHQQGVVDLSWEREGRYLVTVGRDQTARIHAQWAGAGGVWQEVARPQVHGYDMSCVTTLPGHRYVSGAEEKVLRAFSAPSTFLDNLTRITGAQVTAEERQGAAQGASTPSLGLSNKAVYQGQTETPAEEKHVKDQFPDHYFTPETHEVPPPEETLVQNTLWPEEHKLYGHGYELFCVSASPCGRLVASACRSQDAASAQVLLWDTGTWSQVASLPGHNLTVTQMSWSPDSSKLVTVSRDRTWTLHRVTVDKEGDNTVVRTEVMGRSEKKSSVITRIIWSCDWTCDSRYFLTASRDKRLVIWGPGEAGAWRQVGDSLSLPDAVTSVTSASRTLTSSSYLVAAGLENGAIHVMTWALESSWSTLMVIDKSTKGHHATVTRLQFRPNTEDFVLASCSTDTSVRIIKLKI